MERKIPSKARKVLSFLANGEILKFRRSSRGYFKIATGSSNLWSSFHRKTLLYAMNRLYQRHLINIDEGLDGFTTIAVTEAGEKFADQRGDWSSLVFQPEAWDKKWRLVLFDVPEERKKSREAFRYHLRRIGFTEFRRSAFLFPYPCAAEIDALAKELDLDENIAFVTAESISDELKFKKHFGLPY